MNLLLDLLDSMNPPKIQSQALLALVAALLDCPSNTRIFESIDGLLTVTSLFKSRSTTQDVKMRSLEFLYFYLMSEAPVAPHCVTSAPNTAVLQRNGSKAVDAALLARQIRTHSSDGGMNNMQDEHTNIRTTEEKQELLGRYLSNVGELVQDLHESAPFSVVASA
jgi:hypothetical protein